METLQKPDVLRIHSRLVLDFESSADPIAPPGVRSEALLESAIGRQHVAIGDNLKYGDVHINAATLLYGICHDHPFHNGNKRTSLVAMLAHLDKNKHTLVNVGRDNLFEMIVNVAMHQFWVTRSRTKRHTRSDDEVQEIGDWVQKHLYRYQKGERQITFHQLRGILLKHDFEMVHPKNNSIEIVKIERRIEGFIRKREIVEKKRINSITYPGEKRIVPIGVLKHVRRICQLTEGDGVDSAGFYEADDDSGIIDGFINEYRSVLRRLANR